MLRLKNLYIGYEKKILLENINLNISPNNLTVLIGENGSGKSTLFRTLARLQKPIKGGIFFTQKGFPFGDKDIFSISNNEFAKLVSYVSTDRPRAVNLSVYDLVSTGRSPYTNWRNELREEDRSIIEEAISLVDLERLRNSSTAEISDGELQRAVIARVLAQKTPIIILDEPTAFLDIPNKRAITQLLKKICKENGKTIILSSHESEVISSSDILWEIRKNSIHLV